MILTSDVCIYVCTEGVLSVEERGLVLVMSAIRVAWAGGGDGEMALRADTRSLAAFVRDPAAVVTAAIMPFALSAKYDAKVRSFLHLSDFCLTLPPLSLRSSHESACLQSTMQR